jgi:hypothetical protein
LGFENVTLGIGEVNLGADFMMYPNPVSNGTLTISMNTMAGNTITINIVDMAGKKVMKSEAIFENTGNSTLNVDGLTQGIYILNMETLSGKLSRKLIIE